MSDQPQWEPTPENTPTEVLNQYTSDFIEQLRQVELIKASIDGEEAAYQAAEQAAQEAAQAADEAVSVCSMVAEISEALRLKEEAARVAAGLPPTPVGELPSVASQLLTPLSGADAASEELVLAREARINAEKGQLQLMLSAAMAKLKAELAAIRQSLARESRIDAENRLLIADAESKIIFAQLDILRKYEPVWVIEKKLGEMIAEQHKLANRANAMSSGEHFLTTARKDLAGKIADLSRDLRPYEKAVADAAERAAEAAHAYEAELASSGPEAEQTVALELRLSAMKLACAKAEEERDAAKAVFHQYISQLEQDTGRYVKKYQQETLAIWEQSGKLAQVIAEQQTQYSRTLTQANQSVDKESQVNSELEHIISRATSRIREIHRETLTLVEQLQPALAEIGLAIKDIKGRKDLLTGDNGDLIHQAYLLISSSGEVAGQAAQTRYETAYRPGVPPLHVPSFSNPQTQEPLIIARPEFALDNLGLAVQKLIKKLAEENALQAANEAPGPITDAEVSERETERLLRADGSANRMSKASSVPTAVRLAFLEGIARAEAVEAELDRRQPETGPVDESQQTAQSASDEPDADDEPVAREEATHGDESAANEQAATSDEPAASEEATANDEPATGGDEPVASEEPAASQEATADDEPTADGDEPALSEEATANEEPTAHEEATGGDEPVASEEPAASEEATASDEPAADGEQATANDEPAAHGDEPADSEQATANDELAAHGGEPADGEQATANDEPAAHGDEPVASEEPAASEQVADGEEPAARDRPAAREEATHGDEPAASEHVADGEEPAAYEEANTNDEPAVSTEPAVSEQVATDEPATREEATDDESIASEGLAVSDEPAAYEEASANDEPAVSAEPAVSEQVAAEEPENATPPEAATEGSGETARTPMRKNAETIEQTLIIELDKKAARAGVSRAVRQAFREGITKAELAPSEEQPNETANIMLPAAAEEAAATTSEQLKDAAQPPVEQAGEPGATASAAISAVEAIPDALPTEPTEKKPKFGRWLRGRKKTAAAPLPASAAATDKNPEQEAARVSAEIEEMRQKLAAVTFSKRKEQEIQDRKQRKEQEEKRRRAEEESARIRAEEERAQKEAEEIEARKLEEQRQAALEMEKLAENLAAAVEWMEQEKEPSAAQQKPATAAKPAAAKAGKKTSLRPAAPLPPPPGDDNDDSDLEIELRRLILSDFKKNNL